MLTNIPPWLRWIILLPASLSGGFFAGHGIYLLNSAQAARPDAPAVYIADFLGSLASNYVAIYLAHEIAPSAKQTVVLVLLVIGGLSSLYSIYDIYENLKELVGVTGNLVGCYLGWRKFVREQ